MPLAAGRRGHRTLDEPLLLDMAIHHFDLLRMLLGREPELVSCHAWNRPWTGFDGPPTAVATILFEGGAVASYRASWITRGPDTAWAGEWRMTFERGEVWWTSRAATSRGSGDRVVMRHDERQVEVPLPPLPAVDRAGCLAEFVAAVRAAREPESSGRENLGSLALALAAIESARRGAAVGPTEVV